MSMVILSLICGSLWSCKENFMPQIKEEASGNLVVQGFINVGNDPTTIKLSRTIKLTNNTTPPPERGAIVTVETDAGVSYNLTETSNGLYTSPGLNADKTKKFRLRIKTKNNKIYLSDFVESKTSAPLDLTSNFENNNLNIYAGSTDASGNSGYYQYSFVETYEYTSFYTGIYKVENQQIVVRNPETESVRTCWRSIPSTNINLFTTKNLSEDKVNKKINSVPSTSEKLGVEYSILVTQMVLTKQGYDFWSALNKNTEQIGGLFDIQPSLLKGNIHEVSDPTEIVIGFISAGTTSEKRLFVNATQLPASFKPFRLSIDQCRLDTIKTAKDFRELVLEPPTMLFYPVTLEPLILGTTNIPCADCTAAGGTNKKPSFWR